MKKVFTLITLSFLLALTGCNTVRGIGQDIGSAGAVIENAAKK